MDIEGVKRQYLELAVKRVLIRKQIKDINNWFIADLKSRDIIPSAYSCQRCGNMLVTEEPVKIITSVSPLCPGCLGNVTVSPEAVEKYIDEHWKEVEN